MSRKYQPRKPTGREYVDYAIQFNSLTILNCMKLPNKWMDTLLHPLIRTTQEIEQTAVFANKIYINEHNMDKEALIKAYGERMEQLQKALRLFAVFDVCFDRLMSFVDISFKEKERLKKAVVQIVYNELARLKAEEESATGGSILTSDANAAGAGDAGTEELRIGQEVQGGEGNENSEIEEPTGAENGKEIKAGKKENEGVIRIVSCGSDMVFRAVSGDKSYRLKLTAKGRDLWLKAERESEKYIRSRLDSDKKAVTRLQKA